MHTCPHSQVCYGIQEIPEGEWYCERCSKAGIKKNVSCVACPNTQDQAFKPTTDGKWIHVACALWHAEPVFEDPGMCPLDPT